MGVIAIVSDPAEMVNVSPIATVLEAVSATLARNVPPEDASQNDRCEYVSAVDTLVHVRSALVVMDPAEAAENVACWRLVLPAAFEVPADPGSPVWSFTQNAAGCVQATFLHRALSIALAMVSLSPAAMVSS
jgi:hypothetical protein